jgi:RNA polymerase sigma-70 factor (family 1)
MRLAVLCIGYRLSTIDCLRLPHSLLTTHHSRFCIHYPLSTIHYQLFVLLLSPYYILNLHETLPYNERDVLLRIAQGNEQAFATLFEKYRDKLYYYILTITASAEAAEDVVHDVFLKIWINREKLPDVENLNAYLFMMCRNQAINGLRRMAKETLILAELRKEHIQPLEGIDAISQKEIRTFIQQAVEKLSPQQKKVFLLSRQDGLKHEQIGKALEFLRQEIGQSYGNLGVAICILYKLS